MAVAALAAAPAAAAQSGPDPIPCLDPRGCPDMIVDAGALSGNQTTQEEFSEYDCDVQEGLVQAGERRLLRFDFFTPNIGKGDLIIGSPLLWPDHYEFSLCHAHQHLQRYADYRLWTSANYDRWQQLRAAQPGALPQDLLAAHPDLAPIQGRKQGYCLLDVEAYGGVRGASPVPKYLTCDTQGQSVGWGDVYSLRLPGQYIDITGVAPGDYVLEGEINIERLYTESDYTNNRAAVPVTIE